MESGRKENKRLTAVEGTNLNESATHSYPHIEIPSFNTATPGNHQYNGEDDSERVLTGNGGGGSGGAGGISSRWGYTTPSGSRFEINDTPGGEHITLVHKSGSGVSIESDGAVHLYSTSQRGGGLSAPMGDVYINSGGEIVIRGGSTISIDTTGDLNLNVGGNLNIKCAGFNLITENYDATIDGASSTSITNDSSVIIGGIDRRVVAGDQREQVTGKKVNDIGSDYTVRTGGDYTSDIKGKSTHTVDGDHTLSSKAKTKILSGSDTSIDSGGNLSTKTSGQTLLDSEGDFLSRTAGYYEIGSQGNLGIGAGGSAIFGSQNDTSILGLNTTVSGDSLTMGSSGLTKLIGATTDVSGSTVNIKTGTLNSPVPSGAAGGPDSFTPTHIPDPQSPDNPDSPKDAKDAETMESKDIVDGLTSARKFPEYPGNGVLESADATNMGRISHDTTDQADDVFNEYSGGNTGNINPSSSGGTYDNLPEEPINRDPNISVINYDVEAPSQQDLTAKISKYFTLGALIKAKHSHRIPPNRYQEVVKNHIQLANNVLDPIKEKFPDILITSCYRSNSSNHRTGKAVDLVVQSRSMTKHAEIARFARDNLPVDQVFLERNTSGRTHVHLRVGSGNPSVMTCGDAQCRVRVPGIQVEWLSRKGR